MANNPTPIILKVENEEKLSQRLQEAQANCTTNLLSVSHLFVAAQTADEMLAQTPLPKKLWNHIEVPVDPHQAADAKWRRPTTVAYLARSQHNYRLTTVFRSSHQRSSDSPQQPPLYLYLSAAERDALLASFLREHRIVLRAQRAARRAKGSAPAKKPKAPARNAQNQQAKPAQKSAARVAGSRQAETKKRPASPAARKSA